ncbi:MAG: hypothetical protein IJS73_05575 [Paludibacteraceae bacterium]|nr:hypothetical protein [Paludibacteraceae bacterium]
MEYSCTNVKHVDGSSVPVRNYLMSTYGIYIKSANRQSQRLLKIMMLVSLQ